MKFEEFKTRYQGDKIVGPMFNSGWSKMEKYYSLTDETPAYVAALVLDPNLKWKCIHENWDASWVGNARKMVEKLWEDYKPKGSMPTNTPSASEPSTSSNAFSTWRRRHQSAPNLEDEYKRYCASDCTFDVDTRMWWLEKTQQQSYPNLSRMALDMLSIPAMAADPERLFSSAKLVISDLRNKLGIDIIEAFECLKSWYKIKGWQAESKWLEEVLSMEVKDLGENSLAVPQTEV